MDPKDKLFADLKSPQPHIRQQATETLWTLWYKERGEGAYNQIMKGVECLAKGEHDSAQEIFEDLRVPLKIGQKVIE